MSVDVHAQEVRRQALLQHMQLEVWLPRQTLPFAAQSRDYLLDWSAHEAAEAEPQVVAPPSHTQPPSPSTSAGGVSRSQQAQSQLQQIRQTLAGKPAAEPEPVVVQQSAPGQEQAPVPAAPAAKIPRFTLQLLRSGRCLLLLDLPVAEPLQARDPEYLLLKDILRAGQLPHEPSQLRNAEPIRWPLLSAGQLTASQDAEAARVYVRELLLIEAAQQPTVMVWLLGEQAVRFANQAQEFADAFGITALHQDIQLWSLPSLEQLMQQPALKRQLWHSMQQRMPRWVQHD